MKIHYDPKIDAVYFKLAKGKYDASREISSSIIVDEDKNGKVLGIEILDATKNINAFNPKNPRSSLSTS
ncbi:MAG: DUF2283 domain-containing protein [Patescibacteria group bacterium]|mgnify:CR=1 FL=1